MPSSAVDDHRSDSAEEEEEPTVVIKMGEGKKCVILTVHKSARKYVKQVKFSYARDMPLSIVSPFENVTKALHYGLQLYDMAREDDTAFTGALSRMTESRRERYLSIYTATVKLVPGLKKYIKQSFPSSDDGEVFSYIATMSNNARTDHTHSLRNTIPNYVLPADQQLVPLLADSKKADRGLKHAQLRRFFCPASRLDEFDQDPDEFTALFRGGEIEVTIDESKGKLYYPLLLYQNYTVNPDNILEGIFESEVIYRTWVHFNYGPAAAKDMHKLNLPSVYKGNAKKNGRERITGHDVAFSTLMALFALSEYDAWEQFIYGIDLKKFFDWISNWLGNPDDVFARAVLGRWNVKIFGHELGRGHSAEDDDNDAADTAPPAPDPLMLARQALNEEARREREKSSTRPTPPSSSAPSRTPTSPPPPPSSRTSPAPQPSPRGSQPLPDDDEELTQPSPPSSPRRRPHVDDEPLPPSRADKRRKKNPEVIEPPAATGRRGTLRTRG